MHKEKITTESGTTVVHSNNRWHGSRDPPILYLHGGPGSYNPYVIDWLDYDGPIITYAQFVCGGSDDKDVYSPELS